MLTGVDPVISSRQNLVARLGQESIRDAEKRRFSGCRESAVIRNRRSLPVMARLTASRSTNTWPFKMFEKGVQSIFDGPDEAVALAPDVEVRRTAAARRSPKQSGSIHTLCDPRDAHGILPMALISLLSLNREPVLQTGSSRLQLLVHSLEIGRGVSSVWYIDAAEDGHGLPSGCPLVSENC